MQISYFTFMVVLLVLLCAGLGVLFLQNELLRKNSVNWLYLLTGVLAIYCIEKAGYAQPFQHTFLLVAALCLIPITIDSILDRGHKFERQP
jgi:drug/metabolite transporter (DMT)-like permease